MGAAGEQLACQYLLDRGFTILHRNWRHGRDELDIVARQGDELVVVEVKRRARLAEAGEAVRRRQQRRIVHAAQAYVQRHPELAPLQLRFDALLLVPRRLPHHIANAWSADSFLP